MASEWNQVINLTNLLIIEEIYESFISYYVSWHVLSESHAASAGALAVWGQVVPQYYL